MTKITNVNWWVFILFLIIIALLGKIVLDHLSLPIAGINQAGNCVYLEVGGKRQVPCPYLPQKYIKESVEGWE